MKLKFSPNELRACQEIKQFVLSRIQDLFFDNRKINTLVSSNKLSKEQAVKILMVLEKYNINKCICCQQFGFWQPNRSVIILEEELQPLIDIVREEAMARQEKNISF